MLSLQIAFSLLMAHIIGKLVTGDTGSLSLSFIEEVTTLSTKVNLFSFYLKVLMHYML